jgi:hypothetical protein
LVGNDFDGAYSSLTDAPKIYTQDEIDNITVGLLNEIEKSYRKISKVISISSSRNVNNTDVGNTIACASSATLTIGSGIITQVGDIINLEVHGTTLSIQGAFEW